MSSSSIVAFVRVGAGMVIGSVLGFMTFVMATLV